MKKKSIVTRMFAVLLIISMITTILPGTAFAATDQYQEAFTFTITDGTDPVEGAEINYDIMIDSERVKNGTAQTDAKGEAVISDMVDYTDDIAGEAKTVSISYSVSKDGYKDSTDLVEVTDPEGKIEVTLNAVKKVTVSASQTGKGTVKLNDEVQDEVVVDEGSTVKLSVESAEGYRISAIAINNVTESISDVKSFEKTITADSDVLVSVTFVQECTVKVTYDNTNGQVTTDPQSEGGSVTVAAGSQVKVAASPNTGYRVSEVKINGEVSDKIKGDNDEKYSETFAPDQDIEIEITFVPNIYKVTVTVEGNGTAKASASQVEYGKSSIITFVPNDQYYVESVKINGSYVEGDGSDSYTIENITEDKSVIVKFSPISGGSSDDYSWNTDAVVRTTTEGSSPVYIIKKDTSVTFTYNKGSGIKVSYTYKDKYNRTQSTSKGGSNSSSVTLSGKDFTEVTITGISIWYKDHDYQWWPSEHAVSIEAFKLSFDNDNNNITAELTPESANKYGFYNKDVTINVVAAEKETYYSGISSVKYQIKRNGTQTDWVYLYQYESGSEYKQSFEGVITVKAAENNYDNVEVGLEVEDRAGNINSSSCTLNINCTNPEITIDAKGNLADEALTGYYNEARSINVTITDRASCFDADLANAGIEIKSDGEQISDKEKSQMIKWTHKDDVHTAVISFDKDAVYEWSISYTNKADLTNEGKTESGESIYAFTVDTTAPDCSITVDNNSWDDILSKITFGIWKKSAVTAVVESTDDTSGVQSIKYYKTNDEAAISGEELEALYNDGQFSDESIEVSADERFTAYARVADKAGNVKYIGTNGVIVDMTASKVQVEAVQEPNEYGFYNSDVDVKVTVNEDNEIYSGIKRISYKIIKDAGLPEESVPEEYPPLYEFEVKKPAEDHPSYSELEKEQTFTITVDAEKYDSDRVQVIVTVEDNAGNISEDDITIAIRPNAAIAKLQFDNNSLITSIDGRGYYDAVRSATLIITDYSSTFDEQTATEGIVINAVDVNGKEVSIDTESMISSWDHDGDIHTATIDFFTDANYTWSFDYTNKAGVALEKITTEGCETPFTFTVDTTNPTGTVQVKDNIWTKLLSTITFGLYSNKTLSVSATAEDATTPVKIEYYKTFDTIYKGKAELDKLTFSEYTEAFDVKANQEFVVYLKITDTSENYIYICSDGYLVDDVASEIKLTPDKSNVNGLYNKNVNMAIEVTEKAPYSGINTIEYWVECNGKKTQSATLYSYDYIRDEGTDSNGGTLTITDWDSDRQENTAPVTSSGYTPAQTDLKQTWSGSIVVDSSLNNSCNVEVFVKTVDNAGNENVRSIPLDIDITSPSIRITYDNNKDNDGNTYFDAARKATVTITERNHHFDAASATAGIVITAADVSGKAVEGITYADEDSRKVDNASFVSEWKTTEGKTPDETVHTAVITFDKEANYTFSIAYTDKADNTNNVPDTSGQTAPYKFTVDTISPTGSVTAKSAEGRESTWSSLVNKLTFGFWSNKNISISGTSEDATSPIIAVDYYMPVSKNASDSTSALSASDLDKITDWKEFSGLTVDENNQFAVYIRITDAAGNYTYVGTNGLIVDDQHPIEEAVAPEITVTPEQPVNGIYRGDVKVAISVNDPLVGGTYSGLKEIRYAVFDRTSASPNTATQEGVLYSFTNDDPTQAELLKIWSGEITVSSAVNNSNDIQIVVYATDNAGNYIDNEDSAAESYTSIKIDVTAPVINISYDNNSAEGNQYFKENRTATIRITERNFDANDVRITMTNTDGTIPAVSSWSESRGSYNQDDSVYTATITYSADGDYTFAIDYTDLAGNRCTSVNYAAGTVAGTEFTIDKTIPEISLVYDNNDAQNGNYYKAARVATITINEHNFSEAGVTVTVTASDDGSVINAPQISGWSSNGNIHTATVVYSDDGLYTFNIAYTDMAGNPAVEFAQESFYVDKTAPALEISGVADKSANKGTVAPVITFSDTNIDIDKVVITLTGANRKQVTIEGKYSDIHNGKVFTFDDFEKLKEIDDIYTLTVSLTDKAGNSTSKTIDFSVNRFGSTYELDEALQALNGTYVKEPQDIIIKEINADKLSDIKITLFKNNETITLEEGKDYKVDIAGGNGKWYEYTYTIFKENFTDDGVYRIVLHSEDAAKNIAENTLDTKEQEISFGIDKTAPTVNIKNIESGKTYNVDSMTVQLSANDNMKLAKVTVILDGKEYKTWTDDELEAIITGGGDFTFDIIGDSTSPHTVEIIAVDAAGNEYTETVERFYVTTNIWVNYFNNKGLFFGSLGGAAAVAALIILLVAKRKKKKEEQ